MFDSFLAAPPEVISARMYAGPGAGSLVQAAASWHALAGELESAAQQHNAVLAGLTSEEWHGPSATAMLASAQKYVAWLEATALNARQTGVQAGMAAEAYETALASVVPPSVIEANRHLRAQLVASPHAIFHLPEIAALDAAYYEYWAQDSAAMATYATRAVAATRLHQVSTPPPVSRDNGAEVLAASASAVNAAATHAHTIIPPMIQALAGGSMHHLASKGLAHSVAHVVGGQLEWGRTIWDDGYTTGAHFFPWLGVANADMSYENFSFGIWRRFFHAVSPLPNFNFSALGAGLGGGSAPALTSAVHTVSAEIGSAPMVGGLSVPNGWAAATPAVRLAATALPMSTLGSAASANGASALLSGMLSPAGLGAATGGALGAVPQGVRVMSSQGTRGGVITADADAPVQLDKVLARLQTQQDAVQHWQVDEEHLDELLEELSKKPGFHAVHLTKTPKADGEIDTDESLIAAGGSR